MDENNRRTKELSAFIEKALEIELEEPDRELSGDELKKLAIQCGLSESDWQRLGDRLEGHLEKGRNFLQFANYVDAVEELEQAIILAPYRADVLFDCGTAHLKLFGETGKTANRERATELFCRCLELEPDHRGAAAGISELKKQQGKAAGQKKRIVAVGVAALLFAGGSLAWWNTMPAESASSAAPQSTASQQANLQVYRSGNLAAVSRIREKGNPFPKNLPDDFVEIASGFTDRGHVVALRKNGEVICWGENEFGQANPPPLPEAVQVAAGYRHSLALTIDGGVVAWGDNSNGQCNVPAELHDVIQVSAGCRHSLALLSDGTVVAWGANEKGQATVPDNLPPVAQLAKVNADHSVVVLQNRKLAAWGMNTQGQCRVDIPNSNIGTASVVQVLAGGENYAFLDDGRVLHWGRPLRSHPFPAEKTGVAGVFSGFPGAVLVKTTDGKVEWYGVLRGRNGLSSEIRNWNKIVPGPDHIFGINITE